MNVYRLGDGSMLCPACLKKYLDECPPSSNMTCGIECDSDGLPVYGWISGECSDCGEELE